MNKLPADYETCAECGFDHSYEYAEAYKAHREIENKKQKQKEADSKEHYVENQWHYPILAQFGFMPETKTASGMVRSYLYVS